MPAERLISLMTFILDDKSWEIHGVRKLEKGLLSDDGRFYDRYNHPADQQRVDKLFAGPAVIDELLVLPELPGYSDDVYEYSDALPREEPLGK